MDPMRNLSPAGGAILRDRIRKPPPPSWPSGAVAPVFSAARATARPFWSRSRSCGGCAAVSALPLAGVLALAALQAAAFIAQAAGISLLSWAPEAQVPWLTWGVWLFVLATPVPGPRCSGVP